MLASLLALSASFCWGTSDFLAGLGSRRSTAWAVALVGQWVAALGSVLLLILHAPAAPARGVLVLLALGGVSSAVGVFAGYRALTLTKMSVVSPILAGAAVVPVFWGLAQGERPALLQLAGAAATVLGIALLARSGRRGSDEGLPVTRAGVLLAVVSAVGMGSMLVALDHGATADTYLSVAVVRGSAALCVALTLGAARPPLRLSRTHLPLLVVVGLLVLAANELFGAATTMGDLSLVAVLGWLGPAVIIMWARVVLREHLRPVQWVLASVVLIGVVCVALG